MNEIDEKIRRALSAEDRALMDEIEEEQTIFDLIGHSFRGRMKTFMVIAWIAMFAMFGLAVYSLVTFVAASEISTKINWGVGFIVSMQFLAGMKIWYFLELSKLASARDIRRLELRIIEKAG